ncbi:MAG: hypothetical protein WC593_15165 [Methanoregula sp.]
MTYLLYLGLLALGSVAGYLWATWGEEERWRAVVNYAYRMGREKERDKMANAAFKQKTEIYETITAYSEGQKP